jgi:hypothetical protein
VKAFSGEDLNYLGVAGFRVAGGQGIAIIAICQVTSRSSSTRGCHECVCQELMLHANGCGTPSVSV